MPSDLVPDFEIKVLLKPLAVLDSNNKPKDEVLSAFSMPSSSKKMNVQFLDTKQQDIYNMGWNLRIRKSEGEKTFDLTYKKRYPVADGYVATAKDHIDAALKTAGQEGFDTTTSYEAQIEVGYQKQTLSISKGAEVSDKGFEGTSLPLQDDSRKFLTSNAPDKFKDWSSKNWGIDQIANSIIYGPVLAKRYKGTWNDTKLYIEVWPIRKSKTDATLEPIVEASFKTPDLKKAMEGKAKLIEDLEKSGWFLAEDSLKTKLVMERYG